MVHGQEPIITGTHYYWMIGDRGCCEKGLVAPRVTIQWAFTRQKARYKFGCKITRSRHLDALMEMQIDENIKIKI